MNEIGPKIPKIFKLLAVTTSKIDFILTTHTKHINKKHFI